jgi:catechol 2,3-dioxygenase-like lactoylglutathione lyase family enzyme
MVQISGFHHIGLPARDLDLSSDWYERVFGFERLLIEEEETRVSMIMLGHPEGMLLCLHQSPDTDSDSDSDSHRLEIAVPALSFRVASDADLELWDKRLTELGAEHSRPRPAHLGMALDVIDPSGVRLQLHTYEAVSGDDT